MSSSIPERNQPPRRDQIVTAASQLSQAEFRDMYERLFDRKANELFCVFSWDMKKHVRAPGQNKPWVTKQRKLADLCARESGGIVVTLADAIKTMFHQLVEKN